MDEDSWRQCKRKKVLEACTSLCISSDILHPNLCRAANAPLTLSLLWSALIVMLSTLFIGYFSACYVLSKHKSNNSKMSCLLTSTEQGWANVLQWRPLGLKFAALLGLAVFWFDKGSDIQLLNEVWGHTWTGYVLLVLLLYRYLIEGYIVIFHLTRSAAVRNYLNGSRFRSGLYYFVVAWPSTSLFTAVGLDVLLFLSRLGVPLSVFDRHINFEQYQLCRDVGRAIFGTVPTVILQSVTFSFGANPDNGLILTTQVFVLAFVAAGMQLLKVSAELLYLAWKQHNSVLRVSWQLCTGMNVLKEPLQTKSPGLLPPATASSFQVVGP